MMTALVILFALLTAGAAPAHSEPPSIVMIVIDTLRQDHLSLYGYERPTSPGLDALAKESIVFDNTLATSPWTKPSTASLFTGLYPLEHGIHGDNKAPKEIKFLAEALAERGYITAGFSANPYVSETYDMHRGFHYFNFNGGKHARDYADIGDILNAARNWLAQQERAPIFLYLHLMNVHGPYRAPAKFRQQFLEEPYEAFSFRNPIWMDITHKGKTSRRSEVKEEHLRDLRASYDGAIAYTDEMLNDFIRAPELQSLIEEGILLITSDHGEELFDHGAFGHRRTLHAEILNVPLLVRLPGGASGGRRVTQPTSLVDVPATLLDFAGAEMQQPVSSFGRGHSLRAVMTGNKPATESAPRLAELFGKRTQVSRMLASWPYRLFLLPREQQVYLYDVAKDPEEKNDLAAQQPKVVQRLSGELEELLASMHPPREPAEPVEREDALTQQLKALGYLEPEAVPETK